MPIHRVLNSGFFKKWSSDMAYTLGFFAADGSMLRNRRGAHFIEFHVTDREILQGIRLMMGSNHRISARVAKGKGKTLYRLQLGSRKIFDDLQRLGFRQAKSRNMRLPKIPNKVFGDFVRGYFDGDGCVYFKKHYVRSRAKEKWIFSSRFTSGSKLFLLDLKRALKNTVHRGYITAKKRGKKISGYELVFSHRDSIALYRLMYHNTPCRVYLKRKHRLFTKAVKIMQR